MVEPVRIESDHYFLAHHNRRRRTAAIFINQVLNRGGIAVDITFLVSKPSLREVGRSNVARRSAGLGEDDNLGFRDHDSLAKVPRTTGSYIVGGVPVLLYGRELVDVFDLVGDLGCFMQHSCYRTIFFLRQPHRIFDSFMRNLAAHAIG